MRKAFFIAACMVSLTMSAQKQPPLVYDVEDTGAKMATPVMLTANELPVVNTLRNPLLFSNGKKKVKKFKDWERRRHEISSLIQHYEIGAKPQVSDCTLKARMDGDTLIVDVTRGGQTLTLKSHIRYPKVGKAPYPVLIGTSNISLPRQLIDGMPLATMVYRESQVNGYTQWGRNKKDRGQHEFDRLYPELVDNGAYSQWAWGLSRLIDGLQQLGPEKTRIDTRHIGVTGCSYAGKMALFCGAFDERVALTIAQEPGGGGAAAWRVSNKLDLSQGCADAGQYRLSLAGRRVGLCVDECGSHGMAAFRHCRQGRILHPRWTSTLYVARGTVSCGQGFHQPLPPRWQR